MWLLLGITTALSAPLTLDEVLAAVDQRVPELAAAEALLTEAEAKRLAAMGGFDPVLSGKAGLYNDKYPRSIFDTELSATSPWGPGVAVGWTRGTGDFPAYDGDRETGAGGEAYGRIEAPLLQGLGYSKLRANVDLSEASLAAKDAALRDLERKVRLTASKRYWAWVAKCQALEVANAQLALAERRNAAFAREVALGGRARLDLIDNERVLHERRASVAQAEQLVHLTALDLSLFLRDEAGQPRVPAATDAPESWPALPPTRVSERDLVALGWRPDRAKLDAAVTEARVKERAATNSLMPKLNLSVTGTQPLASDDPAEVVGGVSFSAPVAFREGRGDQQAAAARLAATQADLRALDDQIRAEIDGAVTVRRLAEVRAVEAQQSARLAAEVLTMEQRRYELGGSDLFKLLQREDSLAKARKASVDAEYALRVADAMLRAALNE